MTWMFSIFGCAPSTSLPLATAVLFVPSACGSA
jgi:hypothetical protein